MPFFLIFLWDGENEEHLAEHGVTVDEFEFVVSATRRADVQQSRASSRRVVIGETPAKLRRDDGWPASTRKSTTLRVIR